MTQTASEVRNYFVPKAKTIDELYFLAYTDQVTGAYNRNVLEEMREYLDSQLLFVTMADMDNLKAINDKKGHAEGDKALFHIAECLKQVSEAVFRLGGDEFLLLDRKTIDVGTIFGLSYGHVWKLAGEPLSAAMSRADKLMYENKRTKKMDRLKEEWSKW